MRKKTGEVSPDTAVSSHNGRRFEVRHVTGDEQES